MVSYGFIAHFPQETHRKRHETAAPRLISSRILGLKAVRELLDGEHLPLAQVVQSVHATRVRTWRLRLEIDLLLPHHLSSELKD